MPTLNTASDTQLVTRTTLNTASNALLSKITTPVAVDSYNMTHVNLDRLFIDRKNHRPRQMTQGVLSIDEFPKLIGDYLEKAWAGKRYQFSEDYPKEDEPVTPTVVWYVHHRIGSEDGRRRQYKPQPMLLKRSADGYARDIWRQPWAVIYQFDCCGETNEEANALRADFEQFMRDLAPLFSGRGARVYFEEQLDDKLANRHNERLRVRSLRYKVFLQELCERDIKLIERITLEILGELTKIIDEAIVRSRNQYEELAYGDAYYVMSIIYGDTTYCQEIDFHLVNMDGKAYIYWIDGGLSPAAGSTYYVTYYKYDRVSKDVVS